jgi:hypothetical protein
VRSRQMLDTGLPSGERKGALMRWSQRPRQAKATRYATFRCQ